MALAIAALAAAAEAVTGHPGSGVAVASTRQEEQARAAGPSFTCLLPKRSEGSSRHT